MARKLWSQLAKRTKRRYAAQGVSAQKYNAAVKQRLRGQEREQFLGIRSGSISGSVPIDTVFAKVRAYVDTTSPGGVYAYNPKKYGHRFIIPINYNGISARMKRQSPSMRRHIANYDGSTSFDNWIESHDDFDANDNPLWYHDKQ